MRLEDLHLPRKVQGGRCPERRKENGLESQGAFIASELCWLSCGSRAPFLCKSRGIRSLLGLGCRIH
ncbi:hypothetical protein Y1Q_0020959 [Alligator mississippiensis]|uniref:Uncharacterized protein n=1 Tax=Alligator mississippiensis TaxID=8496 RepID=A0A151M1Q4_ALLMI|nr:hypothetical protein Y1Q_0020959 [Alligator mississippiensis]